MPRLRTPESFKTKSTRCWRCDAPILVPSELFIDELRESQITKTGASGVYAKRGEIPPVTFECPHCGAEFAIGGLRYRPDWMVETYKKRFAIRDALTIVILTAVSYLFLL